MDPKINNFLLQAPDRIFFYAFCNIEIQNVGQQDINIRLDLEANVNGVKAKIDFDINNVVVAELDEPMDWS